MSRSIRQSFVYRLHPSPATIEEYDWTGEPGRCVAVTAKKVPGKHGIYEVQTGRNIAWVPLREIGERVGKLHRPSPCQYVILRCIQDGFCRYGDFREALYRTTGERPEGMTMKSHILTLLDKQEATRNRIEMILRCKDTGTEYGNFCVADVERVGQHYNYTLDILKERPSPDREPGPYGTHPYQLRVRTKRDYPDAGAYLTVGDWDDAATKKRAFEEAYSTWITGGYKKRSSQINVMRGILGEGYDHWDYENLKAIVAIEIVAYRGYVDYTYKGLISRVKQGGSYLYSLTPAGRDMLLLDLPPERFKYVKP